MTSAPLEKTDAENAYIFLTAIEKILNDPTRVLQLQLMPNFPLPGPPIANLTNIKCINPVNARDEEIAILNAEDSRLYCASDNSSGTSTKLTNKVADILATCACLTIIHEARVRLAAGNTTPVYCGGFVYVTPTPLEVTNQTSFRGNFYMR